SGRPDTTTIATGTPALFAFAIAVTSSGARERSGRSPTPSAYGFSPTTTTAISAPAAPDPSREKVTCVFFETEFLMAVRIVVPPVVTGPLLPCQVIVHPPH